MQYHGTMYWPAVAAQKQLIVKLIDWKCQIKKKKSCLILQETIRSQTPSWTKFKETESSNRVCGFIRPSILISGGSR